MKNRNNYQYLIGIILLSFILRVVYFVITPLPLDASKLLSYYPDENIYYSLAMDIRELGLFQAMKDEKSIWVAPLNPLYLSFLIGVTSSPILFSRIINIIVSLLTILVTYRITSEIYHPKAGLLAALVVSIYLPLIELSPTLLTEPIYIFLLLVTVYCAHLAIKNASYKLFLMSGLFLGLATLTRSLLLLAPFAFIVGILVNFRSIKRSIKPIVFFILGFSLLVVPTMTKNYIYFDKFTVSNGAGAALYLGSRPDTEGDEPPYRGKDYDTIEITKPFNHLQTEGDQRLLQAAVQNIKSHFWGYLFWDVKKIGRLMTGNQYYWFFPNDNLYSYYKHEGLFKTLLKAINIFIVVSVTIIGSFVIFFEIMVRKRYHLMIFVIVYHIVMSLPFLAHHRYGLPVFCMLSVFFAAAFMRNKENEYA